MARERGPNALLVPRVRLACWAHGRADVKIELTWEGDDGLGGAAVAQTEMAVRAAATARGTAASTSGDKPSPRPREATPTLRRNAAGAFP